MTLATKPRSWFKLRKNIREIKRDTPAPPPEKPLLALTASEVMALGYARLGWDGGDSPEGTRG